MEHNERNRIAVKLGRETMEHFTLGSYFGLFRNNTLLAIAYGKLSAFILMNDNSYSCTTFIEDYTKELQNAIDKENENRLIESPHVDN